MQQLILSIVDLTCADDFQSERVKSEIQIFYQLVNTHPICFTACGFYTINLELLASIILGVFSYQIILVQLKST